MTAATMGKTTPRSATSSASVNISAIWKTAPTASNATGMTSTSSLPSSPVSGMANFNRSMTHTPMGEPGAWHVARHPLICGVVAGEPPGGVGIGLTSPVGDPIPGVGVGRRRRPVMVRHDVVGGGELGDRGHGDARRASADRPRRMDHSGRDPGDVAGLEHPALAVEAQLEGPLDDGVGLDGDTVEMRDGLEDVGDR